MRGVFEILLGRVWKKKKKRQSSAESRVNFDGSQTLRKMSGLTVFFFFGVGLLIFFRVFIVPP
jgi:hypothetical protein